VNGFKSIFLSKRSIVINENVIQAEIKGTRERVMEETVEPSHLGIM